MEAKFVVESLSIKFCQ